MPFNGSGTFSIINTFIPNTTILSSAVNANYTDIASGLSDCLTRDGQAGMLAALSMGSHLINNVTDPVSAQDAATKAYVDAAAATLWSTGDVKLTFKTVADSGWVLFTDGTIGDATSGATVASATTSALFTLLYASPFTDSSCALLTSTGAATTRAAQGTAAAAYAAHCRLSTPKALGRAMALAGTGSGLTARTMGTTVGEETHVLTSPAEIPAHSHSGTTNTMNSNITHTHTVSGGTQAGTASAGAATGGGFTAAATPSTVVIDSTDINHTHPFTSTNTGSGGAHNNMQPSSFLNAMVKL